jgi:hypothetical protein
LILDHPKGHGLVWAKLAHKIEHFVMYIPNIKVDLHILHAVAQDLDCKNLQTLSHWSLDQMGLDKTNLAKTMGMLKEIEEIDSSSLQNHCRAESNPTTVTNNREPPTPQEGYVNAAPLQTTIIPSETGGTSIKSPSVRE